MRKPGVDYRGGWWRRAGTHATLTGCLVLVGLLITGYLAWRLFVEADEPSVTVITDVAFPVVGFLVTSLAIAAARRAEPVERQAWRLLAVAFAAYLLGDLLWAVFEFASGEAPDASLADVFYLLYYPFALAALWRLPGPRVSRTAWAQLMLDGLTFVVLAGVIEWIVVIGPVLGDVEADALTTAVSLAYPVGDLLLLFAIGVVLLRRRWSIQNAALIMLGSAVAMNLLGDLASGSAWVVEGFTTGSTPDLFFMSFWGLAGIGAFAAATRQHQATGRGRDREAATIYWAPYVVAGIGLALPFLLFLSGQLELMPVVGVGASFMAGLVLVRQVIGARELARVAVSEANLASEARLAGLVRQVSDLLLVIDLDCVIRYASPAAGRVVMREPVALVGTPLRDLAELPDRQLLDDQVSLAFAGESSSTRRWQVAGTSAFVESTAAPLTGDPAGPGVILTCRNVTERMKMEADLEEARRLEAVGQLAGGIAHDFNNLLTAIGGYTEMLLQGAPAGTSQHDDLRQIQRSTDRAAILTARMLAVGGRQHLRPERVDIGRIVTETVDVLQASVGDQITILLDVAGAPAVLADRRQVVDVLLILVANARDAIGLSGTITVTVASASDPADQPTGVEPSPAGWVLMSVRDDGSGIPEALQEHLFEPFFTTKGPDRGTGLGLASAYGTVRTQGGWIGVASTPGEGSVFSVYWRPLSEPSGTQHVAPEDPAIVAETSSSLRRPFASVSAGPMRPPRQPEDS